QLPVIFHGNDAAHKLNISSIPPIYYGDGITFFADVFLGLGFQEYGNHSFTGDPDYILKEGDSVLFHLMGFLTGGDISFAGRTTTVLMFRNVYDRVSRISLPWITVDTDPYLVTLEGKIYFALGMYINITMPTMVYSNFYRMLGWALVDVESGYIRFVKYWNRDPLVENLVSFYPWENAPIEFRIQARIPEALSAAMIASDMLIHVRPPEYSMEDWLSGADFYDFIPEVEGYFLLMPINSTLKFVELFSAKFANVETSKMLAAQYVVLSAEDCGKIIEYKMGSKGRSNVISSEFADDILDQNTEVREKFALWKNYSYGNRVPLIVGNNLYWVVPVYLYGTSEMVTLGGIGVVDAIRQDHPVGFGSDVVYAYADLVNKTGGVNYSGVRFLSLQLNPNSINETENATLQYIAANYDFAKNITIRLVVEAENVYVYQYNNNLTAVLNGTEKHFVLFNNTLRHGEIHGCAVSINIKLPPGYSIAVVIINMRIVDEDSGEILQNEVLYITVMR
ncbi:MAG: UPF0182 family protein, partial [Candidatus Korarchaeota archaeon]